DAFAVTPPPDQQQVAETYTQWIRSDLAAHPDALVLMPLLNFDHLFGPGYAGMNAVMQPIFHAAGRVNLDPASVYLIGHSAGGHAAWNLAIHYPTYFAAINVMAGSARHEFQRLRLQNLRNTWPVVWHDSEDSVIRVQLARALIQSLRRQKVDVDYEETRGLGHSPPQTIIEKLYQKTRKRVRPLYPREVVVRSNRLDPIFNRVDWLQVDQPADPGEDQRIFFSLGTERVVLQRNTWSAAGVLRDDNRIDLKVENVELLRVFLNDQMVDLSQPICVAVNGRTRFEGRLQPDLGAMLNDQLFLGRGWRYFPAVLELDVASPPASRPGGAR
ncbi:MAG: alpha/beta hydrolase-fold protein, partial [Phycisphaerae bacterium]|nr:alpha/beta hydrolase-fold protein [Phycisphaerae bacterium]